MRSTEDASTQPRRWSFGDVVLDGRSMQLFVGGRAVPLELKPLEMLRYLVKRPRAAIAKDDLVKAVWPGRVISDSALTSVVAKLREALGNEGRALTTVHGFGYRLDADVRFADGGAPLSDREAAMAEAPAAQRPAAARAPRFTMRLRTGLATATALAALAAAAGWLLTRDRGTPAPSIAVLPFENLSAAPDSAYFTDGLHDTVIGHLSRISSLKVISRTSVMGYRGRRGNLREIARELGVGHILEGSVQRAGDRLRVAAQLVDTATDTHLWTSEYDRDLADVFAVQADIAQRVAAAVHAKLTPQEQARIEAVPTDNARAYDLYLRAVVVERRSEFTPEQLEAAIGWLDEAVTLDPGFAQAYALLAYMHDTLFWFGFDPSEQRQRRAAESADAALRANPNLAEARIAKALHHYHGARDYAAALREMEIARNIAPGHAKVHYWLAPIYRRQGRWDEAVASYERAITLDPLNPHFLSEYAGTLQMLRRYADVDPVLARVAHMAPGDQFTPVVAAYNVFLQDGNLAPFGKALAGLAPDFNPGCQATSWRAMYGLLRRRFDEALAAIDRCPLERVPTSGGQEVPKGFFAAQARWFASGRKRSDLAPQVRAQLEALLADRPDQPSTRMSLAYTLVMLDERSRALEEVDRALASMPVTRDAVLGAGLLRTAAEVHANAGAVERALDELERALQLPAGPHVEELRLDPAFDLLRGHPRFEKLLAEGLSRRD